MGREVWGGVFVVEQGFFGLVEQVARGQHRNRVGNYNRLEMGFDIG